MQFVYLLITCISLMKPFSLTSLFSITRVNLFLFTRIVTRASLLALAKSIYYSDRKPLACQKLMKGPGFEKCPTLGQHKICKCPTPRTAGTDRRAQLELTDALRVDFHCCVIFTCVPT